MSKQQKSITPTALPAVKTLTKEINKVVNNNLQVVTDETDIVNNITVTWDELNELRQEIVDSFLNMINSVNQIITNKEILDKLSKENSDSFKTLVELFYSDVNDQSYRLESLRKQHETKTGKILSLEEFEVYNRLSYDYYVLSNEIIAILSPTITEIIVLTTSSVKNTTEEKSNA